METGFTFGVLFEPLGCVVEILLDLGKVLVSYGVGVCVGFELNSNLRDIKKYYRNCNYLQYF